MSRPEQFVVAELKHAPIEAPHIEVTQSESDPAEVSVKDGGYFQLSHAVFRDPVLRELRADAFCLYLWMSSQGWRFRNSDGSLRASVSFITEAIGMPHATVSRGLKLLKEKGLIELLETNFKRGNLWRITPRAVWNPPGSKLPKSEPPRNEATQDKSTAPSNRGRSHLNLSKQLPQTEVQIRNFVRFTGFQATRVGHTSHHIFTKDAFQAGFDDIPDRLGG